MLQFEEHYNNINILPYSKAVCFILSEPSSDFDSVWLEELRYLVRIKCKNQDKIEGIINKLGNEKVVMNIEKYAKSHQIAQDTVFF